MTKEDLAKAVYDAHGGMSRGEARRIVNLILATIKGRLLRGEKVLISGFGCFRVVQRKARLGVNPKTGMPMTIPGHRVLSFKTSGRIRSV